MSKQVAVEGDVLAIVGTIPYPGANSGSWTALPVQYTAYSTFMVNHKPVIYQAECQFLFTGANAAGVAISGQETVTLTAKPTKLQMGLSKVLVMGDSTNGQYGNQLIVNATNQLSTA